MPIPLYVLSCDGAGLVISIQLNEIPLLEIAAYEPLRSTERITHWAVSGVNTLAIELRSLPANPGNPVDPPPPRFNLQITRTMRGGDPAAAQELYSFHWPGPALRPLPMREQSALNLTGLPTWSWASAPAGPIGPADRIEIANRVVQLVERLTARDADGAVALQAVLLDEQGIAANLPSGDMRRRYAEFLRQRMAPESWAVRPIRAADIDLRALGGGRLQRARRAGGGPAIETKSAEGAYTAEPMLAKVNGRWEIVR